MFAEILSPYQVLHIIDSLVCVYVCACMFVCVAESWTDIILIFTNHFVMKQTDAVHRWRNKPLIFSNGVWQLVFISYGVALSFWVYQSLWCVNIWDLFCQWLLTTEIDCFIKIPFCYINVSRLHFSFEQVYLVRFANVRPSNYSLEIYLQSFLSMIVYFTVLGWNMSFHCHLSGTVPPAYKLPFQDKVGLHPSFADMQVLVCTERERPAFPDEWKDNHMVRFFETKNRNSKGWNIAREWNLMSNLTSSHSGFL